MVERLQKMSILLILLLCVMFSPMYAQEDVSDEAEKMYTEQQLDTIRGRTVVDLAGTLSAEETAFLTEQFETFSHKAQTDAVVVIVESTDDKTPEAFADDYFDYNGYGYGIEREGMLLLIVTGDGSANSRYVHISTSGSKTIDTITDSTIDDLLDAVIDNGLEHNMYVSGLTGYLDALKELYFNTLTNVEIFGAFIVGLIVCLFLYSCIKRAYKMSAAPPFYDIKANTEVMFTSTEDPLISTHTSSVRRPKNKSSSSGSSTHTSSSGRSHGGGGRSF